VVGVFVDVALRGGHDDARGDGLPVGLVRVAVAGDDGDMPWPEHGGLPPGLQRVVVVFVDVPARGRSSRVVFVAFAVGVGGAVGSWRDAVP
jgi:hypothetical protein